MLGSSNDGSMRNRVVYSIRNPLESEDQLRISHRILGHASIQQPLRSNNSSMVSLEED